MDSVNAVAAELGSPSDGPGAPPRRLLTRRGLQVALGLLWLLDGALQLQPFMFTRGFATQVIAPAGEGQPGFVSGPSGWAAHMIAAQPALWTSVFAGVQLAIGVGLLIRRTAPFALSASIAWALGVWYFGEGLAGLASGHASLLAGAPGAAALYALLAAGAWPRGGRSDVAPSSRLLIAWACLWIGAAVLQLLPDQNSGAAIAASISDAGAGAPGWLASPAHAVGSLASRHGTTAVALLAGMQAIVGFAILTAPTRRAAVLAGGCMALAFWVLGQDLGQLYSGQATDPNTGPLLALMAAGLYAGINGAAPSQRQGTRTQLQLGRSPRSSMRV
jgi:hypothetical protein